MNVNFDPNDILKNLKVVQKFMRNSLLFDEAVKFWILYLIFDKNTWYLSKSVISCVE